MYRILLRPTILIYFGYATWMCFVFIIVFAPSHSPTKPDTYEYDEYMAMIESDDDDGPITTEAYEAIRREPLKNIAFPQQLLPAQREEIDDRILLQMNYKPKESQDRTMSVFLRYGAADMYVPLGPAIFSTCAVSNCEIHDSSTMRFKNGDAVLFRNGIPPQDNKRSHADQIWIFYSLENPTYTRSISKAVTTINYTATYRLDSDIPTPYGKYVRKDPTSASPLRKVHKPVRDPSARDETKMIAWFVSHCPTPNKRELVARELAKYIDVDIYGNCGPLSCSVHDSTCFDMLSTKYKFYLAFENGNCDDYITEKFFETALKHNVVPIVYGASRASYEYLGPPHSFIHVGDFKTAEKLADYLKYLDRNETAYDQYFAWKSDYESINTAFWCRLCAFLNAPVKRTQPNLDDWWRNNRCHHNGLPWNL